MLDEGQPNLTPRVAVDISTLRNAPRELRTRRLLLRAPSADQAVAVAALFNASLSAWRFVDWPRGPRSLEWAEQFCARGLQYVDDGENLIFNVFQPEDGACIGRIDLHSFDFDAPRCEIGYVGDPRIAGRGLMREAVQAVVKLCFSIGLVRIEAFSDVRNLRAVGFALGLGFRREGVVRHRERDPEGQLCEQVLLGLLPGDLIQPIVSI